MDSAQVGTKTRDRPSVTLISCRWPEIPGGSQDEAASPFSLALKSFFYPFRAASSRDAASRSAAGCAGGGPTRCRSSLEHEASGGGGGGGMGLRAGDGVAGGGGGEGGQLGGFARGGSRLRAITSAPTMCGSYYPACTLGQPATSMRVLDAAAAAKAGGCEAPGDGGSLTLTPGMLMIPCFRPADRAPDRAAGLPAVRSSAEQRCMDWPASKGFAAAGSSPRDLGERVAKGMLWGRSNLAPISGENMPPAVAAAGGLTPLVDVTVNPSPSLSGGGLGSSVASPPTLPAALASAAAAASSPARRRKTTHAAAPSGVRDRVRPTRSSSGRRRRAV